MSISNKLKTIAENQYKIYEKGYNSGAIDCNTQFWNRFTTSIKASTNEPIERTDYDYAFSRWYPNYFTLDRKICPHLASHMFYQFNMFGDKFDLKQHLDNLGAEIDFSECDSVWYLFAESEIDYIPELKITASNFNDTFRDAKITTIEKIILLNDGTQTFSTYAFKIKDLQNIAFEGVIGESVDFSTCYKLNKTSILNIATHLCQKSQTKYLELSKFAVSNAFGSPVSYTLNENMIDEIWGGTLFYTDNFFDTPSNIKGTVEFFDPLLGENKTINFNSTFGPEIQRVKVDRFEIVFEYLPSRINTSAIYVEIYDVPYGATLQAINGSLEVDVYTLDNATEWDDLVQNIPSNWTITLQV